MIVTITGVFGGADLSSYLERTSLTITAEMGNRMDTCQFMLFDPTASADFHIPSRAEIVIYDGVVDGDAVTDPPGAVSAYNLIQGRITADVLTGGPPVSVLQVDTLLKDIYSQQQMLLGADVVGAGGGNVLALAGDYPAGYHGPVEVNPFAPNINYGAGTLLGMAATSTDPLRWTSRLFAGYVSAPTYTLDASQRQVQVNAQDYTYRLRTTVAGYVAEPILLPDSRGTILPFDPGGDDDMNLNTFILIPTSVSMIPNSDQAFPGGLFVGKPGAYFNRDVWCKLWTDAHDNPGICNCTIYWGSSLLTAITLNPGDIVSTKCPAVGDIHSRVSFDNGSGPVYGRMCEEFLSS